MRRPLSEMSANRRPRGKLSAKARAIILQRVQDRKSGVSITRDMGIDPSTVTVTKRRWEEHGTTRLLPRFGAPVKLDARARRRLNLAVERDPDMTWAAVSRDFPGVSKTTFQRCLRSYKKRKWLQAERPALEREYAQARLAFCRQYRT